MSHEVYTGPAPASDDPSVNPIGELVRLAERLLEQGNLPKAMGYLSMAHAQEPENRYIAALMQRINLLSGEGKATPGTIQITALQQPQVHVKSTHLKSEASTQDTQDKVRRLTLIAQKLFDLGAIDSAFESLMEAYLLDPANPLVAVSEAKMRPLWNLLRTRGVPAYEPTTRPREDGTRLDGFRRRVTTATPQPVLPKAQTATALPSNPDGDARVEERKRDLERARREREQTMWRKASQPPKTPNGTKKPTDPSSKPAPRLRDLDKYDSPKIFRWFRGE